MDCDFPNSPWHLAVQHQASYERKSRWPTAHTAIRTRTTLQVPFVADVLQSDQHILPPHRAAHHGGHHLGECPLRPLRKRRSISAPETGQLEPAFSANRQVKSLEASQLE